MFEILFVTVCLSLFALAVAALWLISPVLSVISALAAALAYIACVRCGQITRSEERNGIR